MRVYVNGYEVPTDPRQGVEIVVEVEPVGEEIGPLRIVLRGGPLRVQGNAEQPAAFSVECENEPFQDMTGGIVLVGEASQTVDTTGPRLVLWAYEEAQPCP